jgi:hypothetical protein
MQLTRGFVLRWLWLGIWNFFRLRIFVGTLKFDAWKPARTQIQKPFFGLWSYSFLHSFIPSFLHSFILSFFHSFIPSFPGR